jgi:small subunit ribosomal protein S18
MANFSRRRKYCKFTAEGITDIDYKDLDMLRGFVMQSGRIIPSRVTGTKARYQRMLAHRIRLARHIALLPFCGEHE